MRLSALAALRRDREHFRLAVLNKSHELMQIILMKSDSLSARMMQRVATLRIKQYGEHRLSAKNNTLRVNKKIANISSNSKPN